MNYSISWTDEDKRIIGKAFDDLDFIGTSWDPETYWNYLSEYKTLSLTQIHTLEKRLKEIVQICLNSLDLNNILYQDNTANAYTALVALDHLSIIYKERIV